jgi:3-deoxy-D-manno-octulosonate 8-phosphate phosphatase (KDO 8-P phosphatase)
MITFTFDPLLHEAGVNEAEVCFAGDDWIDIPVLDRVGLAVTVDDADAIVKSRVHWVTSRAGGQGAVREICDLILHAQGHDRRLFEEILGQ